MDFFICARCLSTELIARKIQDFKAFFAQGLHSLVDCLTRNPEAVGDLLSRNIVGGVV